MENIFSFSINYKLFFRIIYILQNNPDCNIYFIMERLKDEGIIASSNEVLDVLNYLLVVDTSIIKKDYFFNESTYEYLNKELIASSFQEKYYSLKCDKVKRIKFLLCADTHIGGDIYNPILINNVYEYAKEKGVNFAFHLGDLLDKNNLKANISLFAKDYPKYLKTYGILGNHDKLFNLKYVNRSRNSFDLRGLLFFNRNFYMISREGIEIDIGGINIHLNHKLYLNGLERDVFVNDISHLDKKQLFYLSSYMIHISGHMHNGFLYSYNSNTDQKLYIGVPSLSNFNKGKTCAYIVDFILNERDRKIIITPLKFYENIEEDESIIWNIDKENKLIKKLF